MSLVDWLRERKLRPHRATPGQIADLMGVVERDLRDAAVEGLSADRRFATAYSAALQLGTVVLHAGGYRAGSAGHHWVTIQAIPELLGPEYRARADYLDICRQKRNHADYDQAGIASETEVSDLITEVVALRLEVILWLQDNHPDLCT